MHPKHKSYKPNSPLNNKFLKKSSSIRYLKIPSKFNNEVTNPEEENLPQNYYNINCCLRQGVLQQVEEICFSTGHKNCAFAWKRKFRQKCQFKFSSHFLRNENEFVLPTTEREFKVKSFKCEIKQKTCLPPPSLPEELNCLINNNFMTSKELSLFNEIQDEKEEVLLNLNKPTPDTEHKNDIKFVISNKHEHDYNTECLESNNTFCYDLGEGGKLLF